MKGIIYAHEDFVPFLIFPNELKILLEDEDYCRLIGVYIVLQYLAIHNKEFTLSEVAERTHMTTNKLKEILDKLVSKNILTFVSDNDNKSYKLNRVFNNTVIRDEVINTVVKYVEKEAPKPKIKLTQEQIECGNLLSEYIYDRFQMRVNGYGCAMGMRPLFNSVDIDQIKKVLLFLKNKWKYIPNLPNCSSGRMFLQQYPTIKSIMSKYNASGNVVV